ncbi:uncharacterized protein LOC124914407 [Impatiens glandulifera]|uniref:uncharacterized protein LOC124914407 n=1 Tax=Impatiens glandulifera TaxID=253017 RepID=UPI001FB16DE6|nr:uncharacterized protein LOC124914407 [Impatiens glandulifera]
MHTPDKTWMNLARQHRDSQIYIQGVNSFLDFSERSGRTSNISCPCVKCGNRSYLDRDIVKSHLIVYGIRQSYTFWYCHGEKRSRSYEDCDNNELEGDNDEVEADNDELEDDNDELEGDNDEDSDNDVEDSNRGNDSEEPHEEAKAFFSLLNDSKEPLYQGSRISKSSTLLKLLHLKNAGQWTNTSFNMLLKLLKDEILPENSNLQDSYYECKKFIRDIGLSFENIDACKNNCMLFRKEHKDLQSCKICGLSRLKVDNSSGATIKKVNGKTIPNKVLRYFPLTQRLQRLYMCSKTAHLMRWHKDTRVDDDILRHPADSMTWKSFDENYKDFSLEPRNLRLGLANDGFQPFANGKTSYSIWPVILIPYNLPPTICMQSSNFILSMLIPGPDSPGDAIDIYLQPLIDELSELWKTGIKTFDASTSRHFTLRAALLWTINDFPAYANLSGWSTKGKLACPYCNKNTISMRLINGRKECYMCHRRFLSENHKFRKEKDLFDGTIEIRKAPELLSGKDILHQVQDLKEYLIPLATRGLLPNEVYEALVDLSKFFSMLCSKSIKKEDLEKLQIDITLTLCKLEKIFPPSFFDIMVHLSIHFPLEALLGGPVQYRWMYPIEQYMGILKTYVRNKKHPEASISEGYLVNESISLCSRYFEDLSVQISDQPETSLSIFSTIEELSTGTPYIYEDGDRERAHVYILKNCEEAEPFYKYEY